MKDKNFSGQAEVTADSAIQGTAQSPLYNPKLALAFFQFNGTLEKIPGNTPIFVDNEKAGSVFSKSAKMYLLLEGEVGLTLRNKFLGVVKPGEIFGELAVISGMPRTATAMAKIDCSVLSLDEIQFLTALQKIPEFALMLMGIMGQRMRQSIAKLDAGRFVASAPINQGSVLERRKLLATLAGELDEKPLAYHGAGKVIVSAGSAGVLMYIVMEGRVAISVGNQVVEHVEPGGFFGEMAAVDRLPRAATATTETDCMLFSINRNDLVALVKAKPIFVDLLLKSMADRAWRWHTWKTFI